MSRVRKWSGVALGSCLLFLALPAGAQQQSGFELQHLRPNPNLFRGAFVSLDSAALRHGEWRANVLFNYSSNPLVLYNREDERVAGAVTRQATVHLLGSVGLWDFLDIGLDLPLIVHQAGESLPETAAPTILHSAGFGDLRIVPKAQLVTFRSESLGAEFTGAAAVEVFLPTGNGGGLRGDDMRIGPRLALNATFSGGQHFGANLGYLHRSPRQFGDLRVAGAAGWSVYGETPVADKLRLTGELFGQVGSAGPGRMHAPLEALLGAKATTFGLEVLGAVGVGVGRSYGTPDWRALVSVQFPVKQREPKPELPPVAEAPAPPAEPPAPAPAPVQPPAPVEVPKEEPPVVAVAPEPPPEPKPEPKVEAPPAKVRIDRSKRRLELADSIHFKTASAQIHPRSFPLLNEVASVLLAHPEIKLLSIEGHTDNRGGREYNLKLSRARAKSLVQYMISRGVEPSRLAAEGYGLERPVASNATAAGRAKNRRVDFRIAEITWEEDEPQNGQQPSGSK
jgi:outer membrane protein OmpA-like peptidoglycan-associated protein